MRVYRLIWRLGSGPVVAAGTVLAVARLGVAESLALFLPIAFLTGVCAFLYSPLTHARLGRVVGAGLWTGAVVTSVVGLLGRFGLVSLLLVLLLTLASPGVLELLAKTRPVGRIRTLAHGRRPGPGPGSSPSPSPSPISIPGPRTSDDDLTRAWRASFDDLARAADTAARLRVVELRSQLLQEFERRCEPEAGPNWEEILDRVTPLDLRPGSSGAKPHRTPRRPRRE